MARAVLIARLSRRKKSAVSVQKVLTQHGCLIRTRLGIHAGAGDRCADDGLIILELVGAAGKMKELAGCLSRLPGVSVTLVPVRQ